MCTKIIVRSKDKKNHSAYIRIMKVEDIEKILEFQNNIIKDIKDKLMYCETSRKEFENYFDNKDKVVGIYTEEDGLIAMGVYANYGKTEDNYGFDLGIRGDNLLKIGQIDSVAVMDKYRGNKLQKLICEQLEQISILQGDQAICTTIYPENIYSINTFKELGYNIIKEKEKYGSMRRYILIKQNTTNK